MGLRFSPLMFLLIAYSCGNAQNTTPTYTGITNALPPLTNIDSFVDSSFDLTLSSTNITIGPLDYNNSPWRPTGTIVVIPINLP